MSSLPPIPFPPPHQGSNSLANLNTINNINNSTTSANNNSSTNNININNNNNNNNNHSTSFEDSGLGGSIDGSGGGGGLISSSVSIGGSYSDFGDPSNVCTLSSSTSSRWFFSKEQLTNTPSRRAGIDPDKELSLRQQAASFIQDIGQRLQVNQLCINTAIVYMHRFYMYHSFTQFQKNAISTAAIFLAAKVEEQPRKLEYVIKIAHYCLYRDTQPQVDVKSEYYAAQSSELVSNENILLQTLGFDVSVDHPHIHVVKCCQLVRAPKDLAQTSYFMATNSLHLTTMCLQYMPNVVACVCIHLACKWSSWEIPRSKEGREWYYYVCDTMTPQRLETLTAEFLTIFNKSPSRLKKKILSIRAAGADAVSNSGNAGSSSLSTVNKSVPLSKPGVGIPLHHSKQGLPPPGHQLTKHGPSKPLGPPPPPSSLSSSSQNPQTHHHPQHQQHSANYHQSTKDGSNHHPNLKPHPSYPTHHSTANGSHHSHYPNSNRPHPTTHQSSGQSRSSLGPSYPHLGQNSSNSSQVTGSQSNHHYSSSSTSSSRPGLPAPGHPMSKPAPKPQFPYPVNQMHPPPPPHPPSTYTHPQHPTLLNNASTAHLIKDGGQPKEKRRKTTKY